MMKSILGEPLTTSPEHSDSESESGSDSTLEDLGSFPTLGQGYSLQRVGRHGSPSSASSRSHSSDSSNSDVRYDIDFEQLIEDLLVEDPPPLSETRNTVVVAASSPEANDSMMIKRLDRSSPELFILLHLNQRELRHDPWNPAPHIICAVPHDEDIYLCMHRLVEFNQPPLQIVANYIDFFRQVLEGLTFLHEHSIAQLSCRDLGSYMVDLGPTTASASASVESFDRTRYPVHYYFSDLSNAREFESRGGPAFQQDVKDCATMMRHLSASVPAISQKLLALVSAMSTGTFDADASRKLFEALCKALPAEVFDMPVPPPGLSKPPSYEQIDTEDHESSCSAPAQTAMPVAMSVPDIQKLGIVGSNSSLHTVNIPRKPKSNTFSPRRNSPSPTGGCRRGRAQSTEAIERRGMGTSVGDDI